MNSSETIKQNSSRFITWNRSCHHYNMS